MKNDLGARLERRILTPRDRCWNLVVHGERGPARLPLFPLGPIPHHEKYCAACGLPACTSKFCSQPPQTAFLGLRDVHREVYSAPRRMEVNLVLTEGAGF